MKIRKIGPILDFILPEDTLAITLAPFGIYIRKNDLNDLSVINHEKIHWKQQMEMLIIPFYLWYAIESLIRTYYFISFEQEAYGNDEDLHYLETRKPYSWIKYMKKYRNYP